MRSESARDFLFLRTQARKLSVIIPWGALIYAVAVVPPSLAPFDIPSLCGPWGCTAETNDLVAYHLVWLAITVPAAAAYAARSRPAWLRKVGAGLLLAVGVSFVGVLLLSGWIWRMQHPDIVIDDSWRYGLFLLFRNADWPVLPAAGVGIVFLVFGRAGSSRSDGAISPSVQSEQAADDPGDGHQ